MVGDIMGSIYLSIYIYILNFYVHGICLPILAFLMELFGSLMGRKIEFGEEITRPYFY